MKLFDLSKRSIAEQLAYIAGFIDGEGTIGIYTHNKNKSCLQVNVHIANTNVEILEEIHMVLGLGTVRAGRRGTSAWKPLYRLEFNHGEAKELLTDLLPYLQIKKEQAKLSLQFLELQKRVDVVKKQEIALQVKELNKTGPVAECGM